MPLLKDLHIRITSRCNLNCQHCYAADWFKDQCSLDENTTRSAISQAVALGCEKVTFTGGEPLMSQIIVPAIKFCFDSGLKVEIETNGVLLDQLITEAKDYLQKIEFAVSYEGAKMRGERYIDKVRTNIETLRSLNCDTKIQTVITPLNVNEMDMIFGFSKSLGIKNRVFLAHSPNGNAKEMALFSVEQWLKILQYLKSKYSHLIIELPDLFSGFTKKKCGWGVHRCELMPNGDVTSCGPITFNKRDFIAGNVKNQPLEEIWNSSHFQMIRNLTQSDFCGLCAKCPYWRTCLGACRSISIATGGNLLSPHPFCVAFFEQASTGLINDSFICMVDGAKKWLETITSGSFKPSKETISEIVTH